MNKQYGFLFDITACYGCKTCSMACKSEHKTPKGVLWRKVTEYTTQEPVSQNFISMACNHCDKPICVDVCPVEAYSKRDDGIVVQDHEKCIGCKQCIENCPYKTPVYNPAENKVSKCDLCADRLDAGMEPRCVEACPGNALYYGDIKELKKNVKMDWTEYEKRFGLPDHKITMPNLIIKL